MSGGNESLWEILFSLRKGISGVRGVRRCNELVRLVLESLFLLDKIAGGARVEKLSSEHV